ncbi:MAG TPA: hypothetical protein VGH31_07610, partial [Acidimicrobiales bacterium]
STDEAASTVDVTMTVPWTSGQVKIALSDIPGQTLGNTPAPTAVNSTATVVSNGNGTGTVSISIPSFADGDAYSFTVTH